ncbi:MAG: metallophosphoesterase [Planctomycetota bacterium]
MSRRFSHYIGAVFALFMSVGSCAPKTLRADEIRFTSVPDIFNWNIGNPQPGWEETLDWFFDRLQEEGPDFTLNAGDIMDARWWDDAAQVKRKTEEYWTGFMKRFNDRNMTVYVAPGDHEYGDDGGLKIGPIARAFGEQFTQLMGMPRNGPVGHIGRSFSVRKGNLLVVTLDTFEDQGAKFGYTVGDEQLKWLEKTFEDNADAEFIIVQGHLPIVGPVRSKNSSASMLKDGVDSELWKLMVKHQVNAYLCGEHHRITVKQQDGIWQIVHGALWGTQTDLNYMRGIVRSGEMKLELVEFDVEYGGGYLGDHPHRGPKNRPRESVSLTATTKSDGPRVTGELVLQVGADRSVTASTATGWFDINEQNK